MNNLLLPTWRHTALHPPAPVSCIVRLVFARHARIEPGALVDAADLAVRAAVDRYVFARWNCDYGRKSPCFFCPTHRGWPVYLQGYP